MKDSIRPAHASQGHVLVSPSLVLPGHVYICLVMEVSLVLTAGALKPIWSLKPSWGRYKQPEIPSVEFSLVLEPENVEQDLRN